MAAVSAVSVPEKLSRVTELILDQMQRWGWYRGEASRRKIRHDRPSPWDINNGQCDEWAQMAERVVGGEWWWLDDFDKGYSDINHCVLRLNDRFYDAECHEGVDGVGELPIVRRMMENG